MANSWREVAAIRGGHTLDVDRRYLVVKFRGSMYIAIIEDFCIQNSPNDTNAISSEPAIDCERGSIDKIDLLKSECPYPYIQSNVFSGQGNEQAYLFKMSEEGPSSSVDLVKRMQPGGDLQNSWIEFDYFERVKGWTTMSCDVYDVEFCRLMTIAVCEMMSKDMDSQMLMWLALNKVMDRNGVPNPYFKGCMADHTQANWSAVRVVYINGNPTVKMVDRERYFVLE